MPGPCRCAWAFSSYGAWGRLCLSAQVSLLWTRAPGPEDSGSCHTWAYWLWRAGLAAAWLTQSSRTRGWTHVPCTGDTVPPRKFLNIYSSKLLFWFVHELFLFFYYFFKLYKIVLVLPNIKMNPPQGNPWIVSLKASIWGNELFLISCSCRKNFKSFLQRHWAYGWLAASDISRFHPGNITVLSEFSQEIAECLFLKAFSQGLRVGFQPDDVPCYLQ